MLRMVPFHPVRVKRTRLQFKRKVAEITVSCGGGRRAHHHPAVRLRHHHVRMTVTTGHPCPKPHSWRSRPSRLPRGAVGRTACAIHPERISTRRLAPPASASTPTPARLSRPSPAVFDVSAGPSHAARHARSRGLRSRDVGLFRGERECRVSWPQAIWPLRGRLPRAVSLRRGSFSQQQEFREISEGNRASVHP